METDKRDLRDRFFSDSKRYLANSNTLIRKIKQRGPKKEDIHELFRCIHSIKSEGSYLRFESVTDLAHALETQLDSARRDISSVDSSMISDIERQLGLLGDAVTAAETPEEETAESTTPMFNLFEKKLLNEAHRRGDRFYRIKCRLDEETPMKKARAYLILSNLEQVSNVIRMDPSIQIVDDDAFQNLTYYLTGDVLEDELYGCVDIDQVAAAQIETLNFQSSGNVIGVHETLNIEIPSFFSVSEQQIARLSVYADELHMILRDLSQSVSKNPVNQKKIAASASLSNSLIEELKAVRVAHMRDEFKRLRELAEDAAEQLGKKLKITFSGDDVEIDRRLLSVLSDPLNHLVRNSIDHGIESPEERQKHKKPVLGLVSVAALVKGERIEIVVRDDGRGIDEEEARRRSEELSHQADKTDGLIDILSKPGFTTLEHATDLSGRGVGLDLVVQRVRSIGGSVSLSSQVGKGSEFSVSIPRGSTYSQLVFFRYGKLLYAVPKGTVDRIERLQKGDLKKDRHERVYYANIPAFAADRPAIASKTPSLGRYAIVAKHLQKLGCFLADELLFEHDIPESTGDGSERQTRRFSVQFGAEKRDFLYLSPGSIIGS